MRLADPRGLRRRSSLAGSLAAPTLLAALLLAGLHAAGCARDPSIARADSNPAPAPVEDRAEREVPVRTLTVTPRRVDDIAVLPGDLLPLRRAVLAAEVPGTVEAVHVDEGDAVSAGTALLEIDTRALENQVAEAEAAFRQAESHHERAEKLAERRSITEQQRIDAQAAREMAEAQLASARLRLEKSRIEAPWTGTVAKRRVEVGDYVVPGQPVVELVDVRRLEVRAPAPSSDVPYLRVGLPARVRVDAFSDEVFEGRVVRLAAELDAKARTLDVEVEIPNPGGRLRPGLYARMELVRQTLDDALLVPLEAIVELESRKAVYVIEDGVARRRDVELGLLVGDQVVVRGLEPGCRVVVEGQRQVSDGQHVQEQP